VAIYRSHKHVRTDKAVSGGNGLLVGGTRTRCEVIAITQQYAKPFDEVPHGWKTICLVKFEEGIPDIITSLPVVNGWYENRYTVSLCDTDVWRLIADD
jgi:hypothetical protein